MKGFVPPPRYGGVQYGGEPLPITREITVTEGISVKDLAEKLDVRAKDLIATLLMSGIFVTVNQSLDAELVKDVARQFGADTQVITFEDQMANEALENLLGNPLLFLPFGIFGAIFFNSNKKMILIAAFFFSLGIETSQLVFSLGEFDVDDIILNVLGACFGILLWNKYKNKIIRYE